MGHLRSSRLLDHLVLPVAGLGIARARYEALGFTVAADAAHPFGTDNACVFFADKTYLEPLAIGRQADYEAAIADGNVFVARDDAYRRTNGQDGFSAVVVSSDDARADHARFTAAGVSAGDILEFSRVMRLPDGTEGTGSFRLAFAVEPRAPDVFFFACQRIASLPADRDALERHANGVIGLAEVVLGAEAPLALRGILQHVAYDGEVSGRVATVGVTMRNGVKVSVLDAGEMAEAFGDAAPPQAERLRGQAIVFNVVDLATTERHFKDSAIPYMKRNGRLVVPGAPGQGTVFSFGA